MYERPCHPAVGFMFSQHALAQHDSLQPVRTDSPLTHGIMGSVGLCETLRWEMIYCNCILLLYLLCFKTMATFRLLCRIMWILCMHVYKQPEHKHTLCMRYCIPQCTMHDLPSISSPTNELQSIALFLTTFLDNFFWSCCQNLRFTMQNIFRAAAFIMQ